MLKLIYILSGFRSHNSVPMTAEEKDTNAFQIYMREIPKHFKSSSEKYIPINRNIFLLMISILDSCMRAVTCESFLIPQHVTNIIPMSHQ